MILRDKYSEKADKQVNEYEKRVKRDGGEITNKNYVKALIKTLVDTKVYDSTAFWVSANAGLKSSGDTVVVEYDIKGNDLSNNMINARPIVINDVIRKMKGILYDNIDDYLESESFNLAHPCTIFLVVKQDSTMNQEAAIDTRQGKNSAVYFDKGNEALEPLIVDAGKSLEVGTIDENINILTIEMNGDNSNVFINNTLVKSGKIGKSEFNGIRLGALKNLNKNYYWGGDIIECGIIKNIISANSRTKIFKHLEKYYR